MFQTINLSKLFAIALVLKLGTATLGYLIGDYVYLGFVIPLVVMLSYCFLAIRYRPSDLSREKVADSCYYLGFIFTIASIIFALLDIADIQDRLFEIAVRFGAAMISTLIGFSFRVFIVNFRSDTSDAVQNAEDALLQATETFRQSILLTTTNLEALNSKVVETTDQILSSVGTSIERTQEDLSKHFEKRLDAMFERMIAQSESTVAQVNQKLTYLMDNLEHLLVVPLQQQSNEIATYLAAIKVNVSEFSSTTSDLKKGLAATARSFSGLPDKLDGSLASIDKLDLSLRYLVDNIDRTHAAFKLFSEVASSSSARVAEYSGHIDLLSNAANTLVDQITSLRDQMNSLEKGVISADIEISAVIARSQGDSNRSV